MLSKLDMAAQTRRTAAFGQHLAKLLSWNVTRLTLTLRMLHESQALRNLFPFHLCFSAVPGVSCCCSSPCPLACMA